MFRTILLALIILSSLSSQAFDTSKVLRYTQFLSAKMDFPRISQDLNGGFKFPEKDMASFEIKGIEEGYIQILMSGGMNDHLYTMKIFNGKKGKFLTAINLRSGSDGSCVIKCFEVTESKDEIELEENSKSIYQVVYEDLGIDKESADFIRQHPSLIYLGFAFESLQKIKVTVQMNPPFGKENQEVLEKIMNSYPGILEKVLFLTWDRKKSRFIKA